ncbi:MAG TPA: NAD-binding protein [Armatimonadota bacterium]|jgi:voltage-gated potassium channel
MTQGKDHVTRGNWGLRLRQNWQSSLYQFRIAVLLLIILAAIGVTFYRVVLHWSLRDALLQIVYIISTLGGMARAITDPHLANLNKWFDIFYIVTILLVVLWGVSLIIEAMVRGEFVYFWGARRMEQRIAHLSNHYMVCGFGRMGQEIARQLARSRRPMVIIEHNPGQYGNLEASGYPYIQGDARDDDILFRAGIEKAKGLIAVAATDEENMFITLSARVLNPRLYIVTRSSHAATEEKLLRAGADRVFSPYIVGGRRMAESVLHPSAVDFFDMIVHGEQMELALEEVLVNDDAPIAGRTLSEENDVEKLGVHLLGISTAEGNMLMRGLDSYLIRPGDTLILLGEPDLLQHVLKRLTGSTNGG